MQRAEHLADIAPLLVAALAGLVCGALIGLERQWRGHAAGLHTNALVALGAAIYIAISRTGLGPDGAARMAAQVVTGAGFLCAGFIWRADGLARGLNTAATVWCSAAVGLAAGLGRPGTSLGLAILVLLANTALHEIGARMKGGAEP